ncbi:carbonic anhydrase [Micromonospora sp. WMMD980]|uniref:carbonic anhydrase n=1 Tax=Micromonospora sp. WMMD980 TaxID=3016088 RepID=UPI0024173E57|nr:carbonic anhydrase [Micromonospora sp. WMMD980]MDG4800333.1 carbonic anhydrase [Micromonospora sp. WMMD980]
MDMSVSPSFALARLRAGHHRFRVGAAPAPTGPVGAPVAAILSCADPQPEASIVFGGVDVFAVRAAGLRVGPAVLGSLEYAVGHLGVPLVVVLGHTACSLPHGSGPERIRATVDALRRHSPLLDQTARSGRCVLHGMLWHDAGRTLGEIRPVVAVPAARRTGRRRPPNRAEVRTT